MCFMDIPSLIALDGDPMKKFAVAALMFAAAGAALADDPTPDTYRDTVASKTRVQVQAEREQAKRDGTIKVWSTSYNPLTVARSLKTREQVVAELKAAQASGEYAALNAEDGGASFVARAEGTAARHHVASK